LSEDDILSRYDKMQAVVDAKIKAAAAAGKTADVEKLKAVKSGSDELLVKMVTVDCNFVKTKLEPKYRANPNDLVLAKKIFGFMLVGKCTEDPLWLETGEAIHKLSKPEDQDYGLVKNLGVKNLSIGNDEKALGYFKEALQLATTPSDKSETLIYIGTTQAKAGNKNAARESYRQAAAADPSNKEAWEKIGDLYATSFGECGKKESQAQDRLVFIAAYEMYAKSGNQQKMASVKEQFPSKEDIFLYSWKVGDVKSTGCWIGESVALRTRD
jgi:tetratricopeptide (TPR) repeat protein